MKKFSVLASKLCLCLFCFTILNFDIAQARQYSSQSKHYYGTANGIRYELDQKEITIYKKLEAYAKAFVSKSNRLLGHNKKNPQIIRGAGTVTARYIEIDPNWIQIEFIKSNSHAFPYMAKVTYVEKHYTCTAKTEAAALRGTFRVERSRKITELPRYSKNTWVE